MPYVRRPFVSDRLIRLSEVGNQMARARAQHALTDGQRSALMWSQAGNAIAHGIGAVREEKELVPLRQAAQVKMAREAELMRRDDEAYQEDRSAKSQHAQMLERLNAIQGEYPGQPIPTDRLLKEGFPPPFVAEIAKTYEQLFPTTKAPEPFTLNPGDVRFDGTGKQIATVPKPEPPITPPRPVSVPDGGRLVDPVTGKVVYSAPVGPQRDNEPLVQVVGEDGKPVYVRRSEAIGKQPPSGSAKPATGLEKRALNFFNRAQQADVDLEGMEAEITKLGLGGQARLQYAHNTLQTELGQRYRQAQRAFTEARLRKDSGAAIPEQEYENDAKTYFVQPGDSESTQAQKRRARGAVLASLGFESGQALGEFVGDREEAKRIVDEYRARSDKPAAAGVTVTTPDGQTFTFPSKAQADAFKKRAGIK